MCGGGENIVSPSISSLRLGSEMKKVNNSEYLMTFNGQFDNRGVCGDTMDAMHYYSNACLSLYPLILNIIVNNYSHNRELH